MSAGQVIAQRYEIRGILGRGGMGEVYLAFDHRLATEVALKRVPPELALESGVRDALVREARILARLSDTYVVRLFDLADTLDGMFLVLEYVCGPSLDKVLAKRQTLSPDELQHVLDHVAQGLTRAHFIGAIHRDLKPSNLLVALRGEQRLAWLESGAIPDTLLQAEIKVTDFGLAKVVLQSRVEKSGSVSGTPAFMAPEQFRGEQPSVETDVYALGLVAYMCLAGKLPLGEAEPIFFHLFATPPPVQGAPAHMNAAILKAIRKERTERFPSAEEFAAAMRNPEWAPELLMRDKTRTLPLPAQAPPEPVPAPAAPPTVHRSLLLPMPKLEQAQPHPHPDERKAPAMWRIVALMLFTTVLVFAGVGVWISRHPGNTVYQASGSAKDEDDATPANEGAAPLQPLPVMNPAARIDGPPPVIENARISGAKIGPPPGVKKPEFVSQTRVPGYNLWGFGPDGTMYLSNGQRSIAAIRNGQMTWQYALGSDSANFSISPDGLLWIRAHASGPDQLFCFNAAGQGGELVDPQAKRKFLAMVQALEQKDEVDCKDPADGFRDSSVTFTLASRKQKWRTAVDHRCNRTPVQGPDGKVLAQTQSRTVYLLGNDGRVLWTDPAPCMFWELSLLPNDTAVGRCEAGKKLIGFRDGRESFTISSPNTISELLAVDAGSNFYRIAESEIYDRKSLIKTDSNGRDLWTMNLRMPIGPHLLALSPDGLLYMVETSPEGSTLVTIGDHHQ